MQFTFEDISEVPDERDLPWLDRVSAIETLRANKNLSPLFTKPLAKEWYRDGVVILKGFLPNRLMDDYMRVREALNQPGGYDCDTPYMHVPEMKELSLYKPLMTIMKDLIGEPMGLHLNLTGWVSTERNWHQDDYLNPPHVNSWYCAVWMALDDIDPRSGPFQYVPGSHHWPLTRRDLLFQYIPQKMQENPAWPALTQDAVSKCFEAEIEKRGGKVETFLGKRGDVLIWHGRLAHRGSQPTAPGTPRKSLISHYSGLGHRIDMLRRERHTNGEVFFSFPHTQCRRG